jgi:hypothetical protein
MCDEALAHPLTLSSVPAHHPDLDMPRPASQIPHVERSWDPIAVELEWTVGPTTLPCSSSAMQPNVSAPRAGCPTPDRVSEPLQLVGPSIHSPILETIWFAIAPPDPASLTL